MSANPWVWSTPHAKAYAMAWESARLAAKAEDPASRAAADALYRSIVGEYAARYELASADVLAYLEANGVASAAQANDVGAILRAHLTGMDAAVYESLAAGIELSMVSGYSAVVQAPLSAAAFEVVDQGAKTWLTDYNAYWIKDKTERRIHAEIAETVNKKVVQSGLSFREAGAELKSILGSQYARDDVYWRGLAQNASTTARNFGAIDGFEYVGAAEYIIYTQVDERVCPICGPMHDLRFPVPAAAAMRDSMMAASSPEDVTLAHPWHKSGTEPPKDPESVLAYGGHLPPFHFMCRCYVFQA